MRIAVLSESPADQAAVRILAHAILGPPVTDVRQDLQAAGWSGLRAILPVAIKLLHYRCEADGLIVVVDSDDHAITVPSAHNRLRSFQELADQTVAGLTVVSGHPPLRVAVGVAVPALEAWLLHTTRQDLCESAWENGLRDGTIPYTRPELKAQLYGVERPSLVLETERMTQAAMRISQDLTELERKFPLGFGSLTAQLKNWRRVDS